MLVYQRVANKGQTLTCVFGWWKLMENLRHEMMGHGRGVYTRPRGPRVGRLMDDCTSGLWWTMYDYVHVLFWYYSNMQGCFEHFVLFYTILCTCTILYHSVQPPSRPQALQVHPTGLVKPDDPDAKVGAMDLRGCQTWSSIASPIWSLEAKGHPVRIHYIYIYIY